MKQDNLHRCHGMVDPRVFIIKNSNYCTDQEDGWLWVVQDLVDQETLESSTDYEFVGQIISENMYSILFCPYCGTELE